MFVTINEIDAINCLDTAISKKTGEKMTEESKKAQITKIRNLNLKGFKEVICSTGRVFNGVNQLKSETREFLKISGNDCAELDIKACNPSILYLFCSEEEKPRWKNLMMLTGIYEHFTKKCSFKNSNETKSAFIKLIGGCKNDDCKILFSTSE